LRFETLAVHAGAAPDAVTGAVMPAVHLSTTFVRAPKEQWAREDVKKIHDGLRAGFAALKR